MLFRSSRRVWAVRLVATFAIVLLSPFYPSVGLVLAQAPDSILFGPKLYQRSAGEPVTVTDTFHLPPYVDGPFQLHIDNGDVAVPGGRRVTAARVILNNIQVAGPNDFNNQIRTIDRVVALSGGANVLAVTVNGPAEGVFRLTIRGVRRSTVPTALAPNPLTLAAGATGQLTATLSPQPSTGGALNVSVGDSGIISAPSTITYTAGQAEIAIPVTAIAPGVTTLSANANGTTVTSTVQVTPTPVTIASLTPSALNLTEGANGSLTLILSATPFSPTQVQLVSDAPEVAAVPDVLTIPAGEQSIAVPVTTRLSGSAQIVATLNGSVASSQITVNALPPALVSLLPVTSFVTPGASANLTLTITASQGTESEVSLAVNPADIVSVPSAVMVPAGQTQVVVPVIGVAYGQADITARLNDSTASATVSVVPPTPQVADLRPSTLSVHVGATSQFTVTLNAAQLGHTEIVLATDVPGILQAPASVTVPAGTTSANFTVTGTAAGDAVLVAAVNGSQRIANVHVAPRPATIVSLLPNPLPIQEGATGSLVVAIDIAQESATVISLANDSLAVVQVPSSVTIPAGQLSAEVSVTALMVGEARVTASVNDSSVGALVQVTPPPPTVTVFTPASLMLAHGTPGMLRIGISRVPTVATAVALSSSNPIVASVPPTVTVAAGALHAELPVTTHAPGEATVTASLNGESTTAQVTVTAPELVTLTLSPQAPTAYTAESIAFTAIGTMTDGTSRDLTGQVLWNSSDINVATVEAGLAAAVAAGQAVINASYTFARAATGESVTVSASTPLTVLVRPILSVVAEATTLAVGADTIVHVTASQAAPAEGLNVMFSTSGAGQVTIPTSILIPAGQTTAAFSLTATTAGDVTLTAQAEEHLPGSIVFTVEPVPAPPANISVTNPAHGQTISGDSTWVAGSFDGSANTGITVNGVIASVFGNRFFANNVALTQGENTITIVATGIDGEVGRQEFVVTASGQTQIGVERTIPRVAVISTVAGNGEAGFAGDSGAATAASFNYPFSVAAAPDGSLIVADFINRRIRRVNSSGVVTTIAGNGVNGYSGDGGPATAASFSAVNDVAVGPDGSIYVSDSARIRRINSAGIIQTIAGSSYGFSGDGGPASAARFGDYLGLAVGNDGALYVADLFNNRVRKIDSAGIVTTIAGDGESGYSGDGGPALEAQLNGPSAVAVALDGSVYVADANNAIVRRISPEGAISTIAGNGNYGQNGNDVPAIEAELGWPTDLAVDGSGNLYIADYDNLNIRRVDGSGVITTIAGTGTDGYAGDGGSPLTAQFSELNSIAVTGDGMLYVADANNHRVRAFNSSLFLGDVGLHSAAFRIVNNTDRRLTRIEADFDGNGAIDAAVGVETAPLQFTYPAPGVYTARFDVTDETGQTYTATYLVVIEDIAQKDAMLRGVYASLLDRLRVGNIPGSLNTISGVMREKYGNVFTALQANLSTVVDQLGTLREGVIGDEMAEYVLVRGTGEQAQAFLIYLLRSEDGVWRIDGM